jgi:hypothetical protein
LNRDEPEGKAKVWRSLKTPVDHQLLERMQRLAELDPAHWTYQEASDDSSFDTAQYQLADGEAPEATFKFHRAFHSSETRNPSLLYWLHYYAGVHLWIGVETTSTVGRPISTATLRTRVQTYSGRSIRSLESALLEAIIACVEARAREKET